MGRGPKVTRLAMLVKSYSSLGSVGPPYTYAPPYITLNNWVEEWIPGAYRGGFPPPSSLGTFTTALFALNVADAQVSAGTPAVLFKATPDALANTNSYWCNQMLTNNQGIDFSADLNTTLYAPIHGISDPDQALAHIYHDPWALNTNALGVPTTPPYNGAMISSYNGNTSPMAMDQLQAANETEWGVNTANAGQMRCAQSSEANSANPNEPLRMMSTADGSTLTIGGGLSVHNGTATTIRYFSDNDPVPLETIRAGTNYPSSLFCADTTYDGVPNSSTYLWSATSGMTGSPRRNDCAGASYRIGHSS